jgi:hypothetical protein
VPDPKRAFDRAFADMRAAADFEAAEDHFGHALADVYSLYELARKPPSDKAARRTALEASEEGRIALAVAWGRTFNSHELIEVSRDADLFSNYFTELFGVLAWRPRSDFTTYHDGEDRHEFYDSLLAGKPVLDTLQKAVAALVAIT